jgi:hypothetical protein
VVKLGLSTETVLQSKDVSNTFALHVSDDVLQLIFISRYLYSGGLK